MITAILKIISFSQLSDEVVSDEVATITQSLTLLEIARGPEF